MTKEQKKLLRQIIEDLLQNNGLISGLADPLFLDQSHLKQLINLPDLLSTILGQWTRLKALAEAVASTGIGQQRIEALILATALKTVETCILDLKAQCQPHLETLNSAILKNLTDQLPAQQAIAALHKLSQNLHDVCSTEIVPLQQLCGPEQPQPIQQRVSPTLLIITSPISIVKDTIKSPTGEVIFEFEPQSASNALCQLHKKHGIVAVKRFQMVNLSLIERASVYNAALHLLAIHPLELSAKIIITPPEGGQKLLVNYLVTKDKTMTIHFLQHAPLLLPTTFNALNAVKQHLLTRYKLQAFLEEGASWQLEELNQVANALSKLNNRPHDLIALEGCTLIRVKDSKDDNPDAKVGGFYTPAKHTLTLTDKAFTLNTERFFGTVNNLCPYSHGIILHEMGHIIEFHDWRAQRKQIDQALQTIEAQLIENQKLSQNYRKQYEGIKLACEQDLEVFQKESDTKQAELLKELENAIQEFIEVRENIRITFNQAITAFGSAQDAAPNGNSQEALLFKALLSQLFAMLSALHSINFSNQQLTLADLALIQDAQTKVQAAEMQFKQVLAGKEKEYAYLAYQVRSLLEQILDILKLYPQINQHIDTLRISYRKRVTEDKQKREELERQQALAKTQAMDIWLEQQTVCSEMQLKLLAVTKEHAHQLLQGEAPTPCLQTFITFVNERKIFPITLYAKLEWDSGNMSEFFAEAYQLFLNDPETLQLASQELYDWFEQAKYL